MRVENEYFIAEFPSRPEVEEVEEEVAGMKVRSVTYTGEAPGAGTFSIRLRFIQSPEMIERVRQRPGSRDVLVDQFSSMLIDEVSSGVEPRFSQDAHAPGGAATLRRFLFEFDFQGDAFACAGEVLLREHCIIEQFAVTPLSRESVEGALAFMKSIEHKRSIV